jgi:hypothetical protein
LGEAATVKMEAAGSCETLVPIKLYDIISNKTIILKLRVIKTSKLTSFELICLITCGYNEINGIAKE